jgi:hypothetical protein
METKLEKLKEVFVQNMLIYNNLLHFFTGVTVGRNQCLSVPLFSADSAKFAVPDLWDLLAIFGQEDRIRSPEPKDCNFYLYPCF